eukprot:6212081-Pleurochrysis_carterae.AAC.1
MVSPAAEYRRRCPGWRREGRRAGTAMHLSARRGATGKEFRRNAVSSRHAGGAAEVHASESARLDPRLGDGNARFDRVGAAPEGHDRHHRRSRIRQHFVGGDGSWPGRTAGPVQHVNRVLHGVVPERGRRRGRRE